MKRRKRYNDCKYAQARRYDHEHQYDGARRIFVHVPRLDLLGGETAHPQNDREEKERDRAIPTDEDAGNECPRGRKAEEADNACGQCEPEP